MIECPYCGADSEATARFCDRCGERLTGEDDRNGVLRRTSVQYLQGVRHGARPLDPASAYHEELRADVGRAIEDFSYLASTEGLDLAALLGVEQADLAGLERDRSPDTDLSAGQRRVLGLAVLIGLLEDAYDGRTLDELSALGSDRVD